LMIGMFQLGAVFASREGHIEPAAVPPVAAPPPAVPPADPRQTPYGTQGR
jgi:hypothetical protein